MEGVLRREKIESWLDHNEGLLLPNKCCLPIWEFSRIPLRDSKRARFFIWCLPQRSENDCFCLPVASLFSLLHQEKKKNHKNQKKDTELFWRPWCSKSRWNFFYLKFISILINICRLVPNSSAYMFWSIYLCNIFEYLACAEHRVICWWFGDEPHWPCPQGSPDVERQTY